MTIYAFIGKTGGGKTYSAMKEYIIPNASEGRKVFTNVSVKLDDLAMMHPETQGNIKKVFRKGDIAPFSRDYQLADVLAWKREIGTDEKGNPIMQGAVLVVDEAHESFPVGKVTDATIEFFTMHRHHGLDIVLMTQNVKLLDPRILLLCHVYISIRNNRVLGFSKNKYRRMVNDQLQSNGLPGGNQIGKKTMKYDLSIFQTYESNTGGGKDVAPNTPIIWLKWPFLALYAIVAGMIFFMPMIIENNSRLLKFGSDKIATQPVDPATLTVYAPEKPPVSPEVVTITNDPPALVAVPNPLHASVDAPLLPAVEESVPLTPTEVPVEEQLPVQQPVAVPSNSLLSWETFTVSWFSMFDGNCKVGLTNQGRRVTHYDIIGAGWKLNTQYNSELDLCIATITNPKSVPVAELVFIEGEE